MRSRLLIVLVGIGLGLLGRNLFLPAAPDGEKTFAAADLEPRDIINDMYSPPSYDQDNDGLIDPIELPPGQQLDRYASREELIRMAKDQLEIQFDSNVHGDRASFHAHGEKVCASGCAASQHPTEHLPAWKYARLIKRFAKEPLPGSSLGDVEIKTGIGPNAEESESSEEQPAALDELIYFGRQTRQLMLSEGTFDLDPQRVEFLKSELRHGHARLEIRVVDEHGVVRTWLPSTRVPFDRRHVFDMEEKNLQPLVTSGTVKRVGLDYLWVRL